ncbi:hypothetical protein ALC62_03949 [Cyphomyrmex costatus]|uniref:Uncharacterized protein n=1 Tax=Cyphomyrmex costatus TaxID=456900 RepID=A0A195CYC8_9HYME|nr:hypothetical protein ALC62_03949 [Cyphomyrmex costatus]
MYLIITLQHPFVVLILRALSGREGSFLLPSIDAEILRPIDALLPHLDEFRLGGLRNVFLLALRSRRHFLAFVTTVLVFVIMILIGFVLVFVVVTLVKLLLAFVIVVVFVIGFMSVIVRVRELRAE